MVDGAGVEVFTTTTLVIDGTIRQVESLVGGVASCGVTELFISMGSSTGEHVSAGAAGEVDSHFVVGVDGLASLSASSE